MCFHVGASIKMWFYVGASMCFFQFFRNGILFSGILKKILLTVLLFFSHSLRAGALTLCARVRHLAKVMSTTPK